MALNYLPFLNNPVKKPTGHEPLASFVDHLKSGAINYDGQPIEPDERAVFTGASRGPRANVLLPTAHEPAFRSNIPLPWHEEIYNANALHVPDLITIGRARAEVQAVAREREVAKMYVPKPKEGLMTLYDSEIAALESRMQEQRFAMTRGGHDAAVVEGQLGRDYQALRDLLNKREEARTGVTPASINLERKLMGELELPADALAAAEAARTSVAAGGGVDYGRIGAVLNPMSRVGADLYGRDYASRRREVDASAFPTRGDPERAPALRHPAMKVPALGAGPGGLPGPAPPAIAGFAPPAVPPGAGDGIEAFEPGWGAVNAAAYEAFMAEQEVAFEADVPAGIAEYLARGPGGGAAGAGAPVGTPSRASRAGPQASPAEVEITPPKSARKSRTAQEIASVSRSMRREREEGLGYRRTPMKERLRGPQAARARDLRTGVGPRREPGAGARS